MSYTAPYIDSAGLHVPTYADILADLIAQAQSIYGSDIYLSTDSMDYQFISIFALKIYDTMQSLQLAYNSRSPVTAIGSALDTIIKLNGIVREKPSYSTCVVTLIGVNGTVITNGVVGDSAGNNWSLPLSVNIVSGGSVDVSAVCQTIGEVTAQSGDINQIITPTQNWISVTNNVAAVVGQSVEADSALRARQAVSTATPSQTMLEGTSGAIASVSGVARYIVYENDTGSANADGHPAHSITAVVEGGADYDIALAIYKRKGLGCYTNGTTTVNVLNAQAMTTPIKFYRPTYAPMDVVLTVKALTGYTTNTTANIKAALVDYLNSLTIGDDLQISSLWGSALSVQPNLSKPIFSISALTAAKHGLTQSTSNITLAFNEVSQGVLGNITVTVV